MEIKYVMLFALLLAVPFVSAAPIKDNRLAGALDNAGCRAEFTMEVLESTANHSGNNLSANAAKLQDDISAFKGFAEAGDVEAFREHLKDFNAHMNDARKAILQARMKGPAMGGVKGPAMGALKKDYDKFKENYNKCNLDSLKKFSYGKVATYDNYLDRAEERVSQLSAKGVETSDLTALIAEARSTIVAPLKDALQVSETPDEIHSALKQYCLFNGCKDGLNFHFAAKFEAEKLDKILELVKDKANEAGLSDKVTSAQDSIIMAKSHVGDESAWTNLKSAGEIIKQILSTLRSENEK